jgi:hypothetical protein
LIWAVGLDPMAAVHCMLKSGGGLSYRRRRRCPGGGGLAGRLTGDSKTKLPSTRQQRECTKTKRRERGFHQATRRGRRGAGGADRRRGAAGGLLLQRGSGSARVLARGRGRSGAEGLGVVPALLYEAEGRRDGTEAVGGGHAGGRH